MVGGGGRHSGSVGGVGMRRTLTLEVAFPFKSHGTLGYARLMQELLRQWENTAELCSLYSQWARREEEGEQEIEKEREREREQENDAGRESVQCHSIQQAMLQSTLHYRRRRHGCLCIIPERPEEERRLSEYVEVCLLYRDRGRMLNFSPVHGGFSFVGCFCPIAELFTLRS